MMNAKTWAAIGLLACAAVAGLAQDVGGAKVRYHNGAQITMDPSVTIRDEDAAWSLTASQIGQLARVSGGQWWNDWQMVATITVTNAAGTTGGQTLTVNGDVRTWQTNWSATGILTNAAPGGAATNLFNAVTTNGFTTLALALATTNSITLTGQTNQIVSVSLSSGWGTVTISTNYPGLLTLAGQVPSAVGAGVTNQWRLDATNAAAAAVAAVRAQGIAYNLTVVTNGTSTATLHFTNGILGGVSAP